MPRQKDGSMLLTQLRDTEEVARKIHVAEQFRSIIKAADGIPLRSKTQYPTYIEGRMLYILRSIAEVEDVSVQELIRTCLEEGIERRVRRAPKKKRGKITKKAS